MRKKCPVCFLYPCGYAMVRLTLCPNQHRLRLHECNIASCGFGWMEARFKVSDVLLRKKCWALWKFCNKQYVRQHFNEVYFPFHTLMFIFNPNLVSDPLSAALHCVPLAPGRRDQPGGMFYKWYTNLSNRTIAITIVVCICMLYVSYTFNTCLIASINRTWKKVNYGGNWEWDEIIDYVVQTYQ